MNYENQRSSLWDELHEKQTKRQEWMCLIVAGVVFGVLAIAAVLIGHLGMY